MAGNEGKRIVQVLFQPEPEAVAKVQQISVGFFIRGGNERVYTSEKSWLLISLVSFGGLLEDEAKPSACCFIMLITS